MSTLSIYSFCPFVAIQFVVVLKKLAVVNRITEGSVNSLRVDNVGISG